MKIFGIAGFKNAGKTTLIVELIGELRSRGLRIATIKHAHHEFDIDHPGKDSHQHRTAGAEEVIISSGRRWAHIRELGDAPEPSLDELLRHMASPDIVLIEGYKHGGHPKLELRRAGANAPDLAATDSSVCLIVCDAPVNTSPTFAVPVIDRADIKAIADAVLRSAIERDLQLDQ
jgi:molybdopterin-guanine dinucleotide biosynthesis adapter protein